MKQVIYAAAVLVMVGCGGDDGGSPGPTDGALPDGAAIDAGLTDARAVIDGPASTTINGCTEATAMDLTASSTTTITFPGFAYSPPCIKIAPNTTVTFSGNFNFHPLRPGTVVGAATTPDPGSPIQMTITGTSATFTFPTAGTFPYYCAAHFGSGMYGAIFVVP